MDGHSHLKYISHHHLQDPQSDLSSEKKKKQLKKNFNRYKDFEQIGPAWK